MPATSQGTIAKWMSERRFGFITRDAGGEVFFHQSDVVSSRATLEPGLRVTFQEVVRDGRARASQVTVSARFGGSGAQDGGQDDEAFRKWEREHFGAAGKQWMGGDGDSAGASNPLLGGIEDDAGGAIEPRDNHRRGGGGGGGRKGGKGYSGGDGRAVPPQQQQPAAQPLAQLQPQPQQRQQQQQQQQQQDVLLQQMGQLSLGQVLPAAQQPRGQQVMQLPNSVCQLDPQQQQQALLQQQQMMQLQQMQAANTANQQPAFQVQLQAAQLQQQLQQQLGLQMMMQGVQQPQVGYVPVSGMGLVMMPQQQLGGR